MKKTKSTIKSTTKRITALLLSILLCATFAACGNDDEDLAKDDLKDKIADLAENAQEMEEAEEMPAQDESGKPFCVGYWKYDDLDVWLIMTDDLRWEAYDASGNAVFNGTVEIDGDQFILIYSDGGEPGILKAQGDKLVDEEGATLSRLDGLSFAASKDDPLTETANFPGKFEAYSINYPARFKAEARTDLANSLRFSNKSTPKGSEDYYSTITVTFQPLVDVDKYMGKGAWLAKPCMGYLINNMMNSLYGPYIKKSLGTDFQDMGSYYRITGYMWLDPSIFPDAGAGDELLGIMQMRYFGPTGYAEFGITIAPLNKAENYLAVCMNMMDTCTYKTNWSTAPKTVPKKAGKAKGKKTTKKTKSGKSVETFYWTDADGDIWYWNGYENVFQSYGSDGYIDDDGLFYENQPTSWDVGDYEEDFDINPYDSDAGYYYEEDEDVNPFDSDAGGYSDPGDYDYDDYSDSGDYSDYGDYGDDDW